MHASQERKPGKTPAPPHKIESISLANKSNTGELATRIWYIRKDAISDSASLIRQLSRLAVDVSFAQGNSPSLLNPSISAMSPADIILDLFAPFRSVNDYYVSIYQDIQMEARKPLRIMSKRLFQGTLYYQIQKDSKPQTQWVRFQDLRLHSIDLILSFQANLKEKRTQRFLKSQELNGREQNEQQKSEDRQQKLELDWQKEIKQMIFLGKEGKILRFELVYLDGSIEMVTNEALRRVNPELLIELYQRNIVIE